MRRIWGFIYILTNRYHSVLYIGVTNNLCRRIDEHRIKFNKGFTSKYQCDKLVYYEVLYSMADAIAREKQLKNWKREWKNKLVDSINPKWEDLYEQINQQYREFEDL